MSSDTRFPDGPSTVWFVILSLFVLAATGVLVWTEPALFQRFFGAMPPFAILLATTIIGGVCLYFFDARDGLLILRKGMFARGVAISALLALILVAPTILVDLLAPFPRDMNVPFPASILFYPAIGFVVEVVFHVLPLTLILAVVHAMPGTGQIQGRLFWGVVFVAFLEPAFQIYIGGGAQAPEWRDVYLGGQLFIFNLLQLWVFRRYGFLPMYAFRMVYYLAWHIVWGGLRLSLLYS